MIFVIVVLIMLMVVVYGNDVCFFVCCIFCVGCNYVVYVCEMGKDLDCELLFFFSKLVDVVVDLGVMIFYLLQIENFYYEVEFVVVIGIGGVNIVEKDVLSYVWGYVIGNDLMWCDF